VLHELLFEDNKREEADPPSSANSSVHSTGFGIQDLLLRKNVLVLVTANSDFYTKTTGRSSNQHVR